MEKENNNKGVVILLIVIIIILAVLCTLFATGTISFNNDKSMVSDNKVSDNGYKDNTTDDITDDTDTPITYSMALELIATQVKTNEKIYIKYPVINYNNNEIEKLNSTIKENVDESIKKIIEKEGVNSTACETFKIEKTGEEKIFDHLVYNAYRVIENEKYLSIIEISAVRTTCASGSHSVINTYVVNKDTKEVLYNADLYEEVNKTELLEYINNSYDQSDWGEESKNTVINNITKVINENKFFVYYNKDNNIAVTFPRPEHPGYMTYKYDGNAWSEGEEPIE